MSKKQFTEEFRVKVVNEAIETGEQGVVARHHDIHPVTLSKWVNNYKRYGKQQFLNKLLNLLRILSFKS